MTPRHALWLALALGACGSGKGSDSASDTEDTETTADSDPDTVPETDTDVTTDTSGGTGTGTDTDTDTLTDTATDTDTDTDTDTGTLTNTATLTDTGTADTDTGTPRDTDTDTGTPAHTGVYTDTDTGTGLGTPAHTGTDAGTGSINGSDTGVQTPDTSWIDTAPDTVVDTVDTSRIDTATVPAADSGPVDTWTTTGGADTHGDTGIPSPSGDTGPLDTGDTGTADTADEALVAVQLADADVVLLGEGVWDQAGASLSVVGDVNADGYDDLLVGAWGHDAKRGAAYLVHGPLDTGEHSLASADAILLGEDTGDWAGRAVAPAGDANGDGYGDLLVGASLRGEGTIYLLHGPVSGSLSLSTAASRLRGENASDRAGDVLPPPPGDLTGDGVSDLLIPSSAAIPPFGTAGKLYVVTLPLPAAMNLGTSAGSIEGDALYQQMSTAVGADVTGDGVSDILAGAGGDNEAAALAGAVFWFQGPILGSYRASMADAKLTGAAQYDLAGAIVAAGGDVDGDGMPDLATTALQTFFTPEGGRVYLLYGGAPTAGSLPIVADAVLEAEGTSDSAGHTVDLASDFDGDGYSDILVGAPLWDGGFPSPGAAYMVYGPAHGAISLADADLRLEGEYGGDEAGTVAAGDLDGDGIPDIAVAAPNNARSALMGGSIYVEFSAP